jgi:molybdate transport system substrate-binding protein
MKARALFLALLLFASTPAPAAEILVSAAASLTDVLEEIAAAYETISGDSVVFNFGSSGALARQIEKGAPVDLFISADEARMDALEAKGLVDPGTRVSVLSNALVIVVPARDRRLLTPDRLAERPWARIAIGDPEVVPAGTYARDYLRAMGVWDRVRGKVVFTEDVRAALAAAGSGNVDAAIVYRTDALTSNRVRIAWEVPAGVGPAISYPFAVTANAREAGAARRFLTYLQSKPARDAFRRAGFLVR